MGFQLGTIALTVYQTTQGNAITDELLQKFAFIPIDGTAQERGEGLTPFDTPLDPASWPMAHNFAGYFALFCLRVDTRRVPGAVMKKHLAEAFAKECESAAKAFISKTRKSEIKEQVKLRLLAKTEPAPSIVDVAVDLMSGRVFFGSVSSKAKETFEALWFAMMGEKLVEQTPETLLEDPFGEGFGVRFLTAAYHDGIKIDGGETLLTVENKATLHSTMTTVAVTTDDLGNVGEAVKQLAGAQVVKAKVHVERQEDHYDLTLTPDFGMTGIKLPKTEPKADDDDPDGVILERLYLLGQVVDVLHRALRETVKVEKAA